MYIYIWICIYIYIYICRPQVGHQAYDGQDMSYKTFDVMIIELS